MGIQGSNLKNPNRRLTFLSMVFLCVVAFGAILYWRQQEFIAQEYVEFPQHEKSANSGSLLKSKNFQIETLETSPSVK